MGKLLINQSCHYCLFGPTISFHMDTGTLKHIKAAPKEVTFLETHGKTNDTQFEKSRKIYLEQLRTLVYVLFCVQTSETD